MFLFSKVFAATILSPVIFLILGICGLAAYRRPRVALSFFIAALGLLYILSIEPTQHGLLHPLESRYQHSPRALARADAYIVLGAGIIEREHVRSPLEKIPATALKRCAEAVYWYRKHPRPIIVCGGSPARTGGSEAACMGAALRALGVPTKHIFLEPFSRNTHENIFNARTIMRQHHWQRPLLITSAAHLPRAMNEAHKAGLRAIPLPCDFQLETPYQHSWKTLIPKTHSLANSFSALKEYVGIAYYYFRY